MLGVKTLNE